MKLPNVPENRPVRDWLIDRRDRNREAALHPSTPWEQIMAMRGEENLLNALLDEPTRVPRSAPVSYLLNEAEQ